MSLLNEAMTKCRYINRSVVPDGEGGTDTVWTDGAEFLAAFALQTAQETEVAKAQGVVGVYTVSTRKNINLQFRDVFRRLADGKIFRVTSDGDDRKTPASARLDMRSVSAEEWSLPT